MRTGLVIAAHGSRHEPASNTMVERYAAALRDRGAFAVVSSAFHQGEPGFDTVLDRLDVDDVTVVPLMTSAGYYCDVVLPRGLKQNRCYPEFAVRVTPPVGMHPAMVPLVSRRARRLMRKYGLEPTNVSLVIVGHGTGRHARSREATIELTGRLQEANPAMEVMSAFLDEAPHVDTVMQRATRSALITCPFLITNGPHAAQDIPASIDLVADRNVGDNGVVAGVVNGRRVVCDRAVGTDPQIVEIIADLADAAAGGPSARVPHLEGIR